MAFPFIPLSEQYERGERNFEKFYLEGADLRGLSLTEINLSEADLTNADLEGADLTQAVLKGAMMTGANLRGAILHQADLSDARLEGANLEGADLSEADLSRADLRLTNLTRTNFARARLVQMNASGSMEQSQEGGTTIRRTPFVGAILREVNLMDANLSLCNLQAVDLSNAKMLRANLSESLAAPLKTPDGQTKVLVLAGADLTLADLRKVQMLGDFRKASLVQADLREASLAGDFREADLTDALALNTVFSGVNFTGATLTHLYLAGCKLNKCLMPNGKPPGWDVEKFSGEPPNPRGILRRQPTYTEFWFETYEEMRALTFPLICVCCCRTYERLERITREVTISGIAGKYEVQVPFCMACLQHHIRSRNVEHWMHNTCTAPGGNAPAVKFEIKSRGMLGGRYFFVLAFASPEYTISFAAGNQLPVKGSKSFY